jgi:hypothetical protein
MTFGPFLHCSLPLTSRPVRGAGRLPITRTSRLTSYVKLPRDATRETSNSNGPYHHGYDLSNQPGDVDHTGVDPQLTF